MSTERKQVDCKDAKCERKGYWIETDDKGRKLFCFRTRHDGQNHAVKLTLEELEHKLAVPLF